jgi:multidrug efflux pump subunit AcrA (membrane-fusion protein)
MTHNDDLDLELEPLPEGVEEPPPLTRTMSVVRWILFGGMCLFALVMVFGYFGISPWAADEAGEQHFHCPMHPTYISNQMGDCPICGMSLVPIGDKGAASSDDMGDDGDAWMNLTQAKHGQYGCPMEAEVVSDSAGRCPICRMFLIQVDSVKARVARERVTESNVPGLVPVMLAPERVQLIGLKTALVELRTVSDPLRLVGYVTPDETRLADVQVRAAGWIQDLFVNETGQRVEKGAPLLSLYSPELYQAWQDYQSARKAELLATDSTMKAIKREITEASLRRMRFFGLSETDIDQGGTSGSNLTLRSPVAGHVLSKSVQAGQYIGPGQSLLTIADLSTVWVVVEVYDRDLGRVRVGDSTTISHSGSTDRLQGRIAYIYPTVSAETRTTRARIEVNNSSMTLRPGMYADVAISKDGAATLAVPADAILDGGETQYAFVVTDGNNFVPRLVRLGVRGDDWVEVLSGLSAGNRVVTSANFLIDSESRLQAAISGMGQTTTDTAQPAHQH